MRKVIYTMTVSVDGYIESATGDISWSVPDAELRRHFTDRESGIGTHLYGRRLYENMTAFWPTAGDNPSASDFEKEYARIWRAKEKIVFSRTLAEAGWGFRLFKGDIAQEIHRLKALPGKDMFVGGAGLAASFMQLGLIDEYWLYLYPILLGQGKPMFPRSAQEIKLKPVETRKFGGGVTLLKYSNLES